LFRGPEDYPGSMQVLWERDPIKKEDKTQEIVLPKEIASTVACQVLLDVEWIWKKSTPLGT
jgi:hypothetical protein